MKNSRVNEFKISLFGNSMMKSALQSSQNVVDQDVFIACEDNLSFTKRLADNSMKLIVTSPPYNMAKAYEKKIALQYYIQALVA